MKAETILLCAECYEGIIDNNTCDVCSAVEQQYYELTEDEYADIENKMFMEKDNYLREFAIHTPINLEASQEKLRKSAEDMLNSLKQMK